ncbi:MAG: MBL fold metallo-hydrolase [Epsilonproteobacteria bacterium]|nr:MBL fold metallo-hydrolase [Campylobacterota bacterium]
MKFTFLGTSAGKPTRERYLSAIGIEFDQDNKWYLFDCGEATQFQLLKSRLSIGKLEAIFITHLHGDHFYGLPGLLASKKMDDALRPLTIYGPKGIAKFIDAVLDVSKSDLGYPLTIIEYENEQIFDFDKFTIKVLPVVHSMDSVAFYIQEHTISNKLDEQKLRTIGLPPSARYGELKRGQTVNHEGKILDPVDFMLDPIQGRSAIVSGDNATPEILGDYLHDLDLLIHESTYTQEVYDNLAVKILHTTAHDLGSACAKYSVKNLIATHISPRYHAKGKYTVEMLYEEIKAVYQGTTFIADDLDEFYLEKSQDNGNQTLSLTSSQKQV